MDPYGALVHHVLFPAWERGVRRRPTLSILRDLERSETASLDELVARQRRDLAALLRHAHAHVPHYRRRMQEAGLAPDDIDGPGDLPRLPMLTRQEARDSQATRVSSAAPRPAIRKTTGGTTGEPLVIRYDTGSEHWRQAIKLRGFSWAGYRVGDRALHYWGEPTRPDTRAIARAKRAVDRAMKRERYVDCTPRGESHLRDVVRAIRRHRPRAVFCYAQAGADLARFIDREGARTWGDVRVICGAERVSPDDRAALVRAFGPEVFETYGCREVMLIGAECEAHDGLHTSMENVIVELVVTEGGRERPAEPGEVGEVVLTDLHNYGMPLIRYANGDLAVAKPRAPCACGRSHLRLESVEGRQTETLRDASGRLVGGMAFNLIVSPLADAVRQFQAIQHPDRSITLKVIPTERLTDSALDHVRDSARRYLPGIDVTIERVDDIPLTKSGKRRVVIVEDAA